MCIWRKTPLSEVALSTCLPQVVGTVIVVQHLSHQQLCDSLMPCSRGISCLTGKMKSYCKFPTPKQWCLELDCCQGYIDTNLENCLPHLQQLVRVGFYFSCQSCRQTRLGTHIEPSHRHKEGQLLILLHSCILENFLPSPLYDYFFQPRKPCFSKMNSTS